MKQTNRIFFIVLAILLPLLCGGSVFFLTRNVPAACIVLGLSALQVLSPHGSGIGNRHTGAALRRSSLICATACFSWNIGKSFHGMRTQSSQNYRTRC